MAKLTFIAVLFVAATAGVAAYGQGNNRLVAPELSKPTQGHLLDQDYLTSTGETVPRPGVPQGSGPTALDRQQHLLGLLTPPGLKPREAGEGTYSTVTCVFTEFAMKQISCAW
jgi:hypothetical protein